MTPTETVLATFAALFINFDADAAKDLLDPGYIQHNPNVPTGADPVLGFIPALQEAGVSVQTHRVIAEGDLVVLHNSYDNAQAFGAKELVGFDVFRVENGKVAEHWDNLSPVTAPNPSGRTQVDGATEITDRDETAENKALVTAFVQDVLVGGAFETVTDYVSTETYLQHNSQIGDGLDGLGAALAAMADQGITMTYSKLHMVVAEGNFVFTAAEGALGDTPTAFYDLFRVKGGKIVEHWDVIQEIPAEMAHENGKF